MESFLVRSLLAAAVGGSCVVAAAQASRPIAHPDQIAGAWEIVRSSGTDGIHLSISTHAEGTGEHAIVSSQTVKVRVYHHEGGRETDSGWYPGGEHLQFKTRDGADIHLTFEPDKHDWSGTWTHGDTAAEPVVLTRPTPAPGSQLNPSAGDWEGTPLPTNEGRAPTRLHIAQSSDGTLWAWMDRFIAPGDQRHGEMLHIVATERGPILQTTSPGGMRYIFRGTLSAHGSTLAGT